MLLSRQSLLPMWAGFKVWYVQGHVQIKYGEQLIEFPWTKILNKLHVRIKVARNFKYSLKIFYQQIQDFVKSYFPLQSVVSVYSKTSFNKALETSKMLHYMGHFVVKIASHVTSYRAG